MHFYHLTPEQIGKLTNRQFNKLVEQAFNIANLRLNGKIEFETEEEKQTRAELEYRKLLEEGKIG